MTAPPQSDQQPSTGVAPMLALAAWYTAQHRADQESLAAKTVAALAPLWKILDFRNLNGTQTTWAQVVAPVLQHNFQASQHLADEYVRDVRWAQIPTAPELPRITPPPPIPSARIEPFHLPPLPSRSRVTINVSPNFTPEPFNSGSAQVSMLITGPGEVKRQMPAPEDQAMGRGFVSSSGAAVRIVGDGGRGVVQQHVANDQKAIGYARVTDSKPCYFCAMLASRGAVFKSEHAFDASNKLFSGDGIAKVHDHCACSLRPVYLKSNSFDEEAKAHRALWNSSTKGFSGNDAVNAFRRAYANATGDTKTTRGPSPHAPNPNAASAVETAAEVAKRHLPALERTVFSLLDRGFAEDSPQVQWNRKQIARFTAALPN